MKKNILLISLTCLFVLLLTATAYVSFSGNIDTQEVTVKSITPIYDISSGVKVSNEGITFNDKNQVVDYKVVIENTQDYDVKINNISLTTPTEEFLKYEIEELEDKVIKANSTKELTVSFETMGIEGWGRNFNDELTANISFEKVAKQEEVIPPVEEETPKEDENTKEEEQPKEEEVPKEEELSKPNEGEESSKPIPQPEAPIKDEKELIKNVEKIEEVVVTSNTIELPKEIKVSVVEKIAVWIYSEPIFLGYFDVVVENGIKKIEGLEEALSKADIKAGDHNIVLVSNEETIGYIPVSINENKELITEDNKRDEAIENPYTSDNKLLFLLIIATGTTGLAIISVSRNKFAKYTLFILMLSPVLTTSAEDSIELPITFNVNFESQNVMKPSGCVYNSTNKELKDCTSYWEYRNEIKNIYIKNEIFKIDNFEKEFDVSDEQNGRVKAYLVENKEDSLYLDLYLQADGIIYLNENASYYFADMNMIDNIDNFNGFSTENVTDMKYMFYHTGYDSDNFTLDLGDNFDTSSVIDMSYMFYLTGRNSTDFILELGDKFDTSKVTNMSYMFTSIAYGSPNFTLDLGDNFDTRNVTNMSYMFYCTGYSSTKFILDLGDKFDTSNVTVMLGTFYATGYNSTDFSLDLGDKFDTSNVTNMSYMFYKTAYKCTNFTLDLGSKFNTSKVTNMDHMFYSIGAYSTVFTLNLGDKFDTKKVTNMSYMFYQTGFKSTNFVLNLGDKFNTSKVNKMDYMFYKTGYYSTKLNASITISNPNVAEYTKMFEGVAVKNGTQIKVNYTTKTEKLAKNMIATKSENSNVVLGNLIVDVDNLSTGDEIHISGEKFNVISQDDDSVTMLAKYNLGPDKTQSSSDVYIYAFSIDADWVYVPGPKEIDIQNTEGNVKTLIDGYVSFLKTKIDDRNLLGNLITLKELESLGCSIPADYNYTGADTCVDSKYKSWLIDGNFWWTRSANPASSKGVWVVREEGLLNRAVYSSEYCIRPTIKISKEALKKSFS